MNTGKSANRQSITPPKHDQQRRGATWGMQASQQDHHAYRRRATEGWRGATPLRAVSQVGDHGEG